MDIESLYPFVTEAIRRAEALEDLNDPGTPLAYLEVSNLEERIAEVLPASDPEGALARRGAVRAALAAKDLARARELAQRYLTESGADAELRSELLRLAEQAERPFTTRFPHAVAQFGVQEIRRLALAFKQQAAPFPIG